ncbi:hypothetical protein KKC63_03065 [Patescibacteria group bacterium]|nr:hypothetical protein [Patescibacteria group bacterium]MBU4023381.1 hypothetical protein [Patescibacteria group bacterium]MBU4078252.1 hypothetical protein [Patescibacteria group bacterium]
MAAEIAAEEEKNPSVFNKRNSAVIADAGQSVGNAVDQLDQNTTTQATLIVAP